jgi:transposase
VIDYHTYHQIRYLREEEHLSLTQIAAQLHLHRLTVSKWAKRDKYQRRAAEPESRRPGKLDAFKSTIARLLGIYAYTAQQIYQKLQGQGYTGRYTILKEYIRRVRPPQAEAFLHLSFAPGQCAQVDFGEWGSVRVGNTRRKLSFFVMVLCWSRRMFLVFTLGQSEEWWLHCHRLAFEYFGCVPAEIMIDNPKVAVLDHPRGGPVIFHPAYKDLADHYGFRPKACAPRKANQKGRVENGVGYVKSNYLAGLEITDFTSVEAAGRVWLETVANVRNHGETKRRPDDMFAEEYPKLRPLRAEPFDTCVVRGGLVSDQCRVVVDTNRYSVPPRYASSRLTMKLYADRLRLFAGELLVAEHVRSYERHKHVVLPDHEQVLLQGCAQARYQKLLLRFLQLCPQAEAYHAQLAERQLNVRHHVQKIVALSESFGTEKTARAIADAHELGAFNSCYIAGLLEQRERFLPEPGALHLTRQSDLLELELPDPDLSLYEPKPTHP